MKNFSQLTVVQHPLIAHKLSHIRDKHTPSELFRRLVYEISMLLFVEATRHLAVKQIEIDTPIESCQTFVLQDKYPLLIPILRAGLGMVDAFLSLIPTAKVGHIGLMRNETTHLPESYYFKIPDDSSHHPAFICDPMLATGGTTVQAVSELKKRGVKDITLVNIIAAPEGVEKVLHAHHDLRIFTASLDRQLNSDAYIMPGLGDAGDRLYGTHS